MSNIMLYESLPGIRCMMCKYNITDETWTQSFFLEFFKLVRKDGIGKRHIMGKIRDREGAGHLKEKNIRLEAELFFFNKLSPIFFCSQAKSSMTCCSPFLAVSPKCYCFLHSLTELKHHKLYSSEYTLHTDHLLPYFIFSKDV